MCFMYAQYKWDFIWLEWCAMSMSYDYKYAENLDFYFVSSIEMAEIKTSGYFISMHKWFIYFRESSTRIHRGWKQMKDSV